MDFPASAEVRKSSGCEQYKLDFYAQKSKKSAVNLPLAPILNDSAFLGFALKVERI
jgi:hypothetical protein